METFELLQSLLKEYTEKEITPEATLKDLAIDSIDVAEVLFSLEEELNITFDDSDLFRLKTVNDVVQLINSKKIGG